MADWYTSSVAYTAVAQWTALHTYAVGNVVRQLASPAVGNERCFRVSAITTGVSGAAEPSWNLTKGSTTSETTVTWIECTGNSANQQQGGVTNTWTAPHARINNAIAWGASGDRFFISSDSAATTASTLTLQFSGTITAPTKIFSVNRTTGNIPPLPADITFGAVETFSNSGGIVQMSGNFFMQGVTITQSASNGTVNVNSGSAQFQYYLNCLLKAGTTVALNVGGSGGKTIMENTPITITSTGSINPGNGGEVLWLNTVSALAGSTISGTIFSGTQNSGLRLTCRGVDFSAVTNNLITTTGGTQGPNNILFDNCKINASSAIVTGPMASVGHVVQSINCDSGATGYRNELHVYQGDLTTETTITRTGGATDGVQAVSHKMVSVANVSYNYPMSGFPIYLWNTVTGVSKTVTVEFISSTALNNDEFWLELEYLGSGSSPLSSFVIDAFATQLTTHALQPSSSAAWNASPATPQKQNLAVTFTPQMVGLLRATPKLGKASATVYVDPLIVLV